MQAIHSTYVFALLTAGALGYLVPGGTATLAEVDPLVIHLVDYALVEGELATLRHNQATTDDAEAEISSMVVMR